MTASSKVNEITINNRVIEAGEGATVLEAAKQAGIYIPTLCHHPSLEPAGTCRLCVVEVKGMRGLPCSCTLPATPGLVIKTDTPRVSEFRRTQLQNIIASHPRDCLFCVENLRCELQKVVGHIGVADLPFKPYSKPQLVEEGLFFNRDYNLCIRCGRCVRACQEIRLNRAIYFKLDEDGLAVGTPLELSLQDANCQFCGACVDVCPTGALADGNQHGLPDRVVRTICPYCGVGCQLDLEIKENRIVQAVPDAHGPANHGQACVKGRFGIPEVVHNPDRLTQPLIRRGGKLEPAGWDEAIQMVAEKLGGYAPDELAVVASAKCTNEENYLMQKLARAVLGTHNVDHCARL